MKTSTMLVLQAATAVQAAVFHLEAVKNDSLVDLAPAPLGLSFEFAGVDKWFQTYNVYDPPDSAWLTTPNCVRSIRRSSEDIHIRVGGKTQDLATYVENPDLGMQLHGNKTSEHDNKKLPHTRFGKEVLNYFPGGSRITVGLNRARKDLKNPADAAYKLALAQKDTVSNTTIHAFELGNEPDL